MDGEREEPGFLGSLVVDWALILVVGVALICEVSGRAQILVDLGD